MKQRGMVEGAQLAHVNLLRWHSGERQLVARCAPQIQMRLRVAGKPPRRLRVRPKMGGEIGTDLVAAWTDARADGRDEVFGIRTVSRRQGANSDGDRTRGCPLPAGMNGRNRASSAIREEDGRVGHLHAGATLDRGTAISASDSCRTKAARGFSQRALLETLRPRLCYSSIPSTVYDAWRKAQA